MPRFYIIPAVERMFEFLVVPQADAEAAELRAHYTRFLSGRERIDEYPYLYALMLWGQEAFSVRERAQMIRDMVAQGAPVNKTNAKGLTPLHLVTSLTEAKLLLELGADINAVSSDGATPLDYASALLREPLAKLLRSRGGRTRFLRGPVRPKKED